MCRIISIANQKGGVGKTTTAMNVGVALRLTGKRVLLIDLDPQANLSTYLGFTNDEGEPIDDLPTISNLMMVAIGQGKKLTDVKQYIRHNEMNNIDYIPSDINLANADCYLAGALSRETVLKRMLTSELISDYDYIIIDCLPSLGVLLMNALVASNGIIIPVQAQKFAFDGLGMLNSIFDQVQATLKPDLSLIGVLPTMVDRTKVSRTAIETLNEKYGEMLFRTSISKSIEAAKSSENGTPLCLTGHKLGQEYDELAQEVLSRC